MELEVLVPGPRDGEVAVELEHEVVVEVVRHPAAVVADVAGDAATLRVDRHHRAFVVGVEDDVRVVAFGEREAELRGAAGRHDLGRHVMVGEVDLVFVGLAHLGHVAEPRGALFLLDADRAGDRHQLERGIVVHPRAGLVGLLDAADLVRVVGIAPAAAHLAGDGSPEVHPPRHRDGGIGVAVGQRELAVGAHQRIDEIDERLAFTPVPLRVLGGRGQRQREADRKQHRGRAAQCAAQAVSQGFPPHHR